MSKSPARKPRAALPEILRDVTSPSEENSEGREKEITSQIQKTEQWRREMEAGAEFAARLGSGITCAELEKLLPLLKERAYSPDAKPEEPASRFFIANTLICTPGNLTTMSAQAKAGKSAALGGMMVSTFCTPEADCLGFVSENPEGFAVVHLDTEQSPFDHWEGIERNVKRAKVEAAPSWLRSYCVTGFTPIEVRKSLRILLQQAQEQCGGIHSVFIDGVADFVADVNDPAETTSLIAEIHGLAVKFKCPIVVVIHVNPGSDFKTRGHLGSQLERKSETNLRLHRDEDEDLTIIWADKNRRAPIPKKSGPCFAWDERARMHVSVENPSKANAAAKAEAKSTEVRGDAKRVFAQAKEPLSYTEVTNRIMDSFEINTKDGAKKKLRKWVDTGVVAKDEISGLYTLAPLS